MARHNSSSVTILQLHTLYIHCTCTVHRLYMHCTCIHAHILYMCITSIYITELHVCDTVFILVSSKLHIYGTMLTTCSELASLAYIFSPFYTKYSTCGHRATVHDATNFHYFIIPQLLWYSLLCETFWECWSLLMWCDCYNYWFIPCRNCNIIWEYFLPQKNVGRSVYSSLR